MKGLIIAVAVLAALLLLLIAPVYVRISYAEELTVRLRVLGIPIQVFSSEEKPKKKEKKPKKAKKAKADKPTAKKENPFSSFAKQLKKDSLSATLEVISELVSILSRAIGRLIRALTVTRLSLHLVVGGDEPDEIALSYGKLNAVLYPALGMIESAVRVKRQDIRLTPDFRGGKSRATFDAIVRMCPLRLLWVVICLLISLLLWAANDKPEKPKQINKDCRSHPDKEVA